MRPSTGLISILLIAVLALGLGTSCNKIKMDVPGKVQGQLLDPGGQGQGYITIALEDVDTGDILYQETTEDTGNFMFESVDPGKYNVIIMVGREMKVRHDSEQINLTPGRTLSKNITVWRNEPLEGEKTE
jgi:hypothetical protein